MMEVVTPHRNDLEAAGGVPPARRMIAANEKPPAEVELGAGGFVTSRALVS